MIEAGTRIKYKSNSMPTPEATYQGRILQVFKDYYLAELVPINVESIYGEPIPYTVAIPKHRTEREILKEIVA